MRFTIPLVSLLAAVALTSLNPLREARNVADPIKRQDCSQVTYCLSLSGYSRILACLGRVPSSLVRFTFLLCIPRTLNKTLSSIGSPWIQSDIILEPFPFLYIARVQAIQNDQFLKGLYVHHANYRSNFSQRSRTFAVI